MLPDYVPTSSTTPQVQSVPEYVLIPTLRPASIEMLPFGNEKYTTTENRFRKSVDDLVTDRSIYSRPRSPKQDRHPLDPRPARSNKGRAGDGVILGLDDELSHLGIPSPTYQKYMQPRVCIRLRNQIGSPDALRRDTTSVCCTTSCAMV